MLIIGISIHALVKRATIHCELDIAICFYFNPRPREEGDVSFVTLFLMTGHFNPRPREEGDTFVPGRTISQVISIHALVKRATN